MLGITIVPPPLGVVGPNKQNKMEDEFQVPNWNLPLLALYTYSWNKGEAHIIQQKCMWCTLDYCIEVISSEPNQKEKEKDKKKKQKGLEGSEKNGLGEKHVFIYFKVNHEATCVSSSFAHQQTVRNTITSPPNNILDTPISLCGC